MEKSALQGIYSGEGLDLQPPRGWANWRVYE